MSIIRGALLPTPKKNADPLERQRAHGDLVGLALITLLLVIDLRPEGMPDGFSGPLYKRLSQELRALEAPVHLRFLAAAFRDRRDARVFLEFLGRGVALPLFAKGHEKAGGKDGPGAWQGIKQGEVRMTLGTLRDGGVKVCDGLQGDAELGYKGLHEEGVGGDDAVIGGQRHGALDGLKACRDDLGRAHVVGTEEAFEGGATRELGGFEGGPATEDVAKERRIFLLKPLQDMREVVFQRTGQAMRQPDGIADEATAVFNELRQGAHGGAWGGKRGEFVAVFEQDLDLEFGIGRVVFGPTRGQRFAVLGHGERIDGKEHEEVLLAQRRHHGPFMEFQAHGNRLAVEPCAQALDPHIDRVRAVFEHEKLTSLSASGL